MSLDVLRGQDLSKKTEIESFVYLMIYFFKLNLPWSHIKSKNHNDKKDKIIKIHNQTTEKELFKEIPYQILFIYTEIKKLKSNENPDYNLYIKALEDIIKLDNNEKIRDFCWEKELNDINKNDLDNIKDQSLLKKYQKLFNGYYNFADN